jgi:prepilin-type N-terminal cleavage/methylation domain-containing protein
MNKKGFTLIELLSVVTLIVLISLIVLPNIVSNINKKKGELSEVNTELLAAATDVYIDNHSGVYTDSFEADGSVYCIPIQSLINDGVLETPFKDVNGNEIDYSDVVKATYNSTYNDFTYEKVSRSSCTEFKNFISRPVLSNNMIPVVYEDGSWKKADANSKWYNYVNKNWANAVVVKEFKSDNSNSKSRFEYLESPAGTIINENDILGFFVWIPRFRYQLFNSSTPVVVNIVFESYSNAKSNGTQIGQWLTHPAFTYNGKELSGIWVGKYEAGNSDNNIVVKSGLTPWTDIGFNDSFSLSNDMVSQNNIYGLNDVNSHLIQNNEWSSVTYLTMSVYGLNNKVNTNSSTTTGGTNSTTGNIYGIYDMAGLSKEFVTVTGENESSIGYSLGETTLWYGDSNSFISDNSSYLARGGTSIFNYSSSNVKNSNTSFRPVIINNEVSSSNQNTSIQYAYFNVNTNSYYSTLKDALDEVHSGETIKVLKNFDDTSVPTVDEGKNVKIDLAGKVITMSNSITNNGILDIYSSVDGGGWNSSLNAPLFFNYGIFTLNGTSSSHTLSIKNSSSLATGSYPIVSNYGTSIFNNNTTLQYTSAVTSGTNNRYIATNYEESSIIVNGASLINKINGNANDRGLLNSSTSSNSSIIFNSGSIDTYGTAILNSGSLKNTLNDPAIKITGGTIISSGMAVYNSKAGSMMYVTGGNITGTRGLFNDAACNIYISGNPIITGTQFQAVRGFTGNVTIAGGTDSGPTLIGYTDGIYLVTDNSVSGSATITGHVSITGQTQYGIQANSGTSVTIGVDDGTVSTTYPYIFANTSNMYGVNTTPTTTFNFYDGKIEGPPGRAISRDPSDTPDGYTVVKTTDGTNQIATLGSSS